MRIAVQDIPDGQSDAGSTQLAAIELFDPNRLRATGYHLSASVEAKSTVQCRFGLSFLLENTPPSLQ